MKKKLLSAFLAFTMIFSTILSNFVFAEDQAPGISQGQGNGEDKGFNENNPEENNPEENNPEENNPEENNPEENNPEENNPEENNPEENNPEENNPEENNPEENNPEENNPEENNPEENNPEENNPDGNGGINNGKSPATQEKGKSENNNGNSQIHVKDVPTDSGITGVTVVLENPSQEIQLTTKGEDGQWKGSDDQAYVINRLVKVVLYWESISKDVTEWEQVSQEGNGTINISLKGVDCSKPTVSDQITTLSYNAGFYIRITDSIIPKESGNTHYPNAKYSGHPGNLTGEVVKPVAVNSDDMDLESYDLEALQSIFNEVSANITKLPTDDAIKDAMKNTSRPFDPETQTVIWYVIKSENCGDIHKYHVDGVIVDKNVKKYTLTYDANTTDLGDKDVPSTTYVDAGNSTDVKFDISPRKGFEFLGWDENPKPESGFPTYTESGEKAIVMNSNKTLYAIWKAIPEYTVTFESKGSGSLEGEINQTVFEGSKVEMPTVKPKYEGANLVTTVVWTNAEGAVYTYDAIKNMSITKNETFTATFKTVKTIYVSYEKGTQGNGTQESEAYKIDVTDDVEKSVEVTISDNKFVPSKGYSFTKWDKYNIGEKVTTGEDIQLVAQWEALPFELTYHSNFKSTTQNDESKKETLTTGASVDLAPKFQNNDVSKKFKGWSLEENSDTILNAYTMPAENEDLYAVWSDKSSTGVSYKIQYVLKTIAPNGDTSTTKTIASETVLFYEGDPDTKVITHPFPASYEGGYARVSAPENMTVTKGDKDLVFTAQYEKNVYQVTYYSNNGANTTVVDTNNGAYYEVGSSPKLAANSFNRSGYNFNGWSLTADGVQQVTELSAIAGNVDVYARWAAIYYPPTGGGDETTGGGTTPTPPVRPTTPDDEVIVDEEAPLARPEEDGLEDIPNDETPLATVPEELELIDDEEVPLANAPKTGSATSGFAMLAIAGLTTALAIFKKKHSN